MFQRLCTCHTVVILDQITDSLLRCHVSHSQRGLEECFTCLVRYLALADPEFESRSSTDVLIGVDLFAYELVGEKVHFLVCIWICQGLVTWREIEHKSLQYSSCSVHQEKELGLPSRFKLDTTQLRMSSSVKYLGLTLDFKLTWNANLDNVLQKAKWTLMMSRRLQVPHGH